MSPLVFTVPGPLTEVDENLGAFARKHLPDAPTRDDLLQLCEAVRGAIRYTRGLTGSASTAGQALQLGAGVCQDSAHVTIAACHASGIPSRYVSGYFFPGDRPEFASHAWVDVWLADRTAERGGNWISLDPTHGGFATDRHIRLAVGRDYDSAAPIRGVRAGGGNEQLQVSVQVAPA
jgi:transglutaminase-like putative cysteine protease